MPITKKLCVVFYSNNSVLVFVIINSSIRHIRFQLTQLNKNLRLTAKQPAELIWSLEFVLSSPIRTARITDVDYILSFVNSSSLKNFIKPYSSYFFWSLSLHNAQQ